MNFLAHPASILRVVLLQVGFGVCLTASAVTFTISPSTISNTYRGFLTLQASGLNANESVVVQRYFDLNTNGIVDSTDWLILQFQLTDGQGPSVIGGATNVNVPYDSNGTSGSIMTQLTPATEGIAQRFVGQSLFVLSSPSNHFTAITNTFAVTAFDFPQSITGVVLSNSIPIPNALVMLSAYRGPGHGLDPLGGAVANASGQFVIKAPPGTYQLHGFNAGALSSGSSPITLGASSTISTNLFVLPATNRISGKFVDSANAGIGLPGILMAASANGVYGFGSTSSNGSFSLPVNAGQWGIGADQSCFSFHGYVTYDNSTNFNVAGNLNGIVLAYPKANGLFYGKVADGQGNPIIGVRLQGQNGNNGGTYQGQGFSDANGNYAIGLIAPGNWDVDVDLGGDSIEFSNYVFSRPAFSYNNGGSGIDFTANMAVKQNFIGLLATNQISGFVRSNNITAIPGVQVSAFAPDINGVSFQTGATTDASGHFVMNVPSGTWNLNLNCCSDCDSGSLPPIYQCPDQQTVTIARNNATVNFNVHTCVLQITTPGLPNGSVDSFYDAYLQASGCYQPFYWSWSGNVPPLNLDPDTGEIWGTPNMAGTFNFSVEVDDNNLNTSSANFSITINPAVCPLEITTTSLSNGTQNAFYSNSLSATCGQLPYTWTLEPGSAPLPSGLSLASNGVISGTPDTPGTLYFIVDVTDGTMNTVGQTLSITILLPPLRVVTANLPYATVGAAYNTSLSASGGQPPYRWSLKLGSAPLPGGLNLGATTGVISGQPTTNGTFLFRAQVDDANFANTNRLLQITVNPKPRLDLGARPSPSQFQFRLTGSTGQNYTLQYSTTLTNWTSFVITNPVGTNVTILDSGATNPSRAYRALIGP